MSSQPILKMNMNNGIMITWNGTIKPPTINRSSESRSGNRRVPKANPAIIPRMVCPTTTTTVSSALLMKAWVPILL